MQQFWLASAQNGRATVSTFRLEFSPTTKLLAMDQQPPRRSNVNWKTAMLMAAIMALFGIVGAADRRQSGMLMALVFGGAMNLFSYWFSDSMVLKMYNAQPVDETSAPQFYAMVRELAQARRSADAQVYLIDEAAQRLCHRAQSWSTPRWRRRPASFRLLSARELARRDGARTGHASIATS